VPETERFANIVFGSGTGGRTIAWTLAEEGQRTAVVERKWNGGSCHNIACLLSNSAKVASLFGRAVEFGSETSAYSIDMARFIVTDPELVRVALNESEARQSGLPYRVTRTISETRGFLKIPIDERGNRIAAVQTAMLGGMEFPALRGAIFAHSTMPEGVNLLLSDVQVRQPEMLQMPAGRKAGFR